MDQPGKVANPARGQLNRENNIPLPPCVPENLVSWYVLQCFCSTMKRNVTFISCGAAVQLEYPEKMVLAVCTTTMFL